MPIKRSESQFYTSESELVTVTQLSEEISALQEATCKLSTQKSLSLSLSETQNSKMLHIYVEKRLRKPEWSSSLRS